MPEREVHLTFASGNGQESARAVARERGVSGPPHRAAGSGLEEGPEPAPLSGELRIAIMAAHRAWALRYCPWTLEEWRDD